MSSEKLAMYAVTMQIMRYLPTICMKGIEDINENRRSQDLNKPPKTAKLVTIGMHVVSQGQWPRMTFERSRSNVKDQMWSCADLNHALYLHSC